MAQKIISIGFDVPGFSECFKPYSSDQSLLDADIIIFEPDFSSYEHYEWYRDKPSYGEHVSFRIQEDTHHWHKEISGLAPVKLD